MKFYARAFCIAIAILYLLSSLCRAVGAQSEKTLKIPAFTAYSEPDPDALSFSEQEGVSNWTDQHNSICWYGYFPAAGNVAAGVLLRLEAGRDTTLRLSVGKQVHSARIHAADPHEERADFGTFRIPSPGYYSLRLSGVEKSGRTFGSPQALLLSGTAAAEAHFNMEARRNAASVHLGYPIPEGVKVTAFYNEVTVRSDPLWSYYMACGFRRGYFGIQVNSPTERRIIFSVWDSGHEAADRSKVAPEDRVQLLEKGPNVIASDFGNEGTGGHSHLVYPWQGNKTYRFLVTAKPDGTHTIYSGWFYFPETKAWGLIARFRAPNDGNTLDGLYSFNENFAGQNGQLRRLAEFGNQWVRSVDGSWTELTEARFTHDPTGREQRKDFGAGVTANRFYLSNGGFKSDPIQYGDKIHRLPGGVPPTGIVLPFE